MRRPIRHITHQLLASVLLLLAALVGASCEREPELFLHRDNHLELDMPLVRLDVDVVWNYTFQTDWREDFVYGWDVEDERIFGSLGYTEPTAYEVRRYFTGADSAAAHREVAEHYITGSSLVAGYKLGYYDILAWNDIDTPDGIQSIIIDETSSLDNVVAFTNMSTNRVRRALEERTRQAYTYYEPENLFSAYVKNILITDDPADYDYYDETLHAYVRNLEATLHPLTYIYLLQVVLHHNRGKVIGTDGSGNLSGMAKGVSVNTGVTGNIDIVVNFKNRFKKNVVTDDGETVDICGGRLTTFGICETNPYSLTASRATRVDKNPHFLDVNLTFNNGADSTFVFDVTDQVRQHYRGGVITVHLDMDTIPVPNRGTGSGGAFDAVVEDYKDGGTHEFEM